VTNWVFVQTIHVVGSKSNFAFGVACGRYVVVCCIKKSTLLGLLGGGSDMGRGEFQPPYNSEIA